MGKDKKDIELDILEMLETSDEVLQGIDSRIPSNRSEGKIENVSERVKAKLERIDEDLSKQAEVAINGIQSLVNDGELVLDKKTSGDVFKDLMDWVSDNRRLPTDLMDNLFTNAEMKVETAQYLVTLENIKRQKNLMEFIRRAEEILFDPELLITMNEDEIIKRYQNAVFKFDAIFAQNRQTLSTLKKSTDGDKERALKVLMGALDQDKLLQIFKAVSKGGR